MSTVKYAHIYADSEGESHVEDAEFDLAEGSYAPPAPPAWSSAFFPATSYHVVRFASGWHGDWHPVPRRQVFFFLKGEVEGEFSDGTRRRIGPGDVVLDEDTWGKGHRSWVVGEEDVLAAVVVLPD